MISNRALTALAIATTCVILTPRASGGGASDGGFTNPFVSASALGKVHTRGACITDGFVRSQGAASGAYRRPTHAGIGSRGMPRASTARTRAVRASRQKSARTTGPVAWKNGGPSHSCHLCEMKFHTGGV
jgi:hypothetical protein